MDERSMARIAPPFLHAPRRVLAAALVALAAAGPAPALALAFGWHQPPTEQKPQDARKPPASPTTPPTAPGAPAKPTAENDPALTDDSVGRLNKDLQRRPAPRPTVQPRAVPGSDPVRAAPGGVPPKLQAASRTGPRQPEGTFLVKQRGSMIRAGSGEWIFVSHPAPGPAGKPPRPMIMLPCQKLAQMEAALESRGPDTIFRLTGQIFVFHEWNYILPTEAAAVSADEEREQAPIPTPPPTPGAPRPRTAQPPLPKPAEDPSVQDLIRELKARREGPAGLSRPDSAPAAPPHGAGAGGAELAAATPEGTLIVRRRARIVRRGTGEWAVTFDNDSDGTHKADPAMTLVPSMVLAQLENLAASRGDNVALEISGRVLAYRGRNYLVPLMYQAIQPGSEVGTMQ
jgi:hypothetical protein